MNHEHRITQHKISLRTRESGAFVGSFVDHDSDKVADKACDKDLGHP